MIYVEYFSRHPAVDPREFHEVMAEGLNKWDAEYAEDLLILSAARTWRIGPNPEYFVVWYSPGFRFERIDDWERIFRSGAADAAQEQYRRVARIETAGCYEPLLEPVRARNATYYAEFFGVKGDTLALRNFYQERAGQHPHFTLNLLLDRIGRLGPGPGGLAVWTLPNFAALVEIAQELDGVGDLLQLEAAGTYADIGREIL